MSISHAAEFVARPLGVYFDLLNSRSYNRREPVCVSWLV
ncbi:NhaP-type Na+/H+ and K+/H+ antiporter [Silvibacterium bohemicum]|uniref:NhaP-type Na+/H+ and K+/H+ antiporter n=1 Tax=Silvibacterium bohemicum TaxID=1577686 RepID=A0A841JMZ7_9BACT|nr:NhaP-type Na+/H+ and K+/H+ antiporter [Silvibacterium bohemicum]